MSITQRNYYYSVQSGDVLEIILKKHGIRKSDGNEYRNYYHDEEAWNFIRRNPTENDELLNDPQIWRGTPHATYGTVHLRNWNSDNPTSEPSPSPIKGADYIRQWCQSDLKPAASARVEWFWNNSYHRYRCPPYNGLNEGSLILYGGERVWIPDENQQTQPVQPPELIKRDITDEELRKGFMPEYNKQYELVIPAIEFVFKMEDSEYSQGDMYTLYGYEKNNRNVILYEETLTIKDNLITQNGQIPKLIFYGTPRNLVYALELKLEKPITDDDGNKIDKYYVFEDREY